MKKNFKWLAALCAFALLSGQDALGKKTTAKIDVDGIAASAVQQIELQYDSLTNKRIYGTPQMYQNGKYYYCPYEAWISGFFPGSLWYLYELTGDPKWKSRATEQTERLERIQYLTSDHDIGFRMGCSYGNGYRITGNPTYPDVLIQSARSLATRFQPKAGVIMSWNPNARWKCPVIIDNMMNL